ncbi:hypothetical protein G7Y89_g4544 [Cudoniella acicularis]|uniref:Zn(2)-C6 fungal-type domain-containing protein n=1 Tax=Cudoniella acicularis TaxID=354080 RepID=A0A8H4RRD5_9HELO|nr:hypothetical protein G7Y89_g4544 [Cudoniella acicularis]
MQRDRVRPDPVSCQSCRSKKLKCNRVQPCSNCTARGITCNFLVPPQVQTDTTSTFHSNAEILARIERLESIVLKQSGSAGTPSKYTPDDTRQQLLYPSSGSVVVSNIHQKRDQDSQLLENVGTREDSLLHRLSNGLGFRTISMHEILHPASVFNGDRSKDTIVTFPVYKIATLLYQSYESNVNHLCHILHTPTVRSLIRTSYIRINQNESVLPGQAALLLSIFALAAYFYKPLHNSEVATTKQDAIHLSKILSRSALDVLDYSRRNTSGTLEDVQAYIFMSFVAYHLDGFSARGRILTTTAISIARELRLHRLDADTESPTAENQTSVRFLIDREVKRRVFWHITSTDWLFSTISGPQEGTYFIHPNHINVRLPKDCTDDELVLAEENEPTIEPRPTSMTFFLERLRLAHLCREMTDIVPLETSKLLQMPYEQIIALDQKLQDFISSLPFFFKLDAESRRRSKPLETMYPKISVARYCITTEALSRRCKLHQRFLHRQSVDPRYAYSRRACLESARAVVQVYEDLRECDSQSTVPELMGMALHFTHLALVVMVMDLCFNRDEADEGAIKGEVKAALEMFEDRRNVSPLLGRFLGSLSEVLVKHEVQLTDSSTLAINSSDNVVGFTPHESMVDVFNNPSNFGDVQMQFTQQLGLDMGDSGVVALDTSFDEFWQTAMQGETNPDSLTWDNLFSALDSRPL